LFSNSSEPFAFVAGGAFDTFGTIAAPTIADPNRVLPLASYVKFSTPICATLQDLDILNNGRITLHNRNLDDPWSPESLIKISLMFVEPNAKVF
jgi:hypothetical protein